MAERAERVSFWWSAGRQLAVGRAVVLVVLSRPAVAPRQPASASNSGRPRSYRACPHGRLHRGATGGEGGGSLESGADPQGTRTGGTAGPGGGNREGESGADGTTHPILDAPKARIGKALGRCSQS